MLVKNIFIWMILVMVLQTVDAQSLSVKVSSKTIGKEDVLQVEYEVKDGQNISGFIQPAFDQWNVIAGPSTTQSVVSVNGQTTRTFSYVFVLSPKKTGTFSVPGASVMADGKKLTCRNVEIEVSSQPNLVAPGQQAAPQGLQSFLDDPDFYDMFRRDPVLKSHEDPQEIIRKNIFVKATVSKSSCFVGEPVLVTYKLYTALHTEARVIKQPTFTGCSVIELMADEKPQRETLNGKDFRVDIVRRVILIPLQETKLTLDNASIESFVEFAAANDPNNSKRYSSIINSQPVNLTVNALPVQKRPASFNGAVGQFAMKAQLSLGSAPVGESDNLVVTISGTGDLQSINTPVVKWPVNTEHFDVNREEHIDKTNYPIRGNIVFEMPFMSTAEGKQKIPPIEWSYFDPSTAMYKTLTTDSLPITFTKAEKSTVSSDLQAPQKDLSNKKYLWIVAGIAVAAAFLLFITLKKSNQPQPIAPKPDAEFHGNALPEKEKVVAKKKDYTLALDMLRQMDEDTLFFNSAKKLLVQALQECLHSEESFPGLISLLSKQENSSELVEISNNVYRATEYALYSGIKDENTKEQVISQLQEVVKKCGVS